MDSPAISQKSGEEKCSTPSQKQVIYYCQVIAIYIIVVACLINLSIGSDKDTVWASMLSACIGYLLPSPKFKQQKNDALLPDTAKQQLSPILPRQHLNGIYNETGINSGINE
jgi:hypothetical protein